jgi:hypothetical protein
MPQTYLEKETFCGRMFDVVLSYLEIYNQTTGRSTVKNIELNNVIQELISKRSMMVRDCALLEERS